MSSAVPGRWLNIIALTVFCGAISACASVPSMPDGRATSMGEAAVAVRFSRPISTVGVAMMPAYQAGLECDYDLRTHVNPNAVRWTWRTRSVRERILAQMEGPYPEPSTVLVGTDGELFDFNVTDVRTGRRSTVENFQAQANDMLAANPDAKIVNDLELTFPHRTVSTAQYGDVVSSVFDSSGTLWAQFIYAGSTTHNGRQGLVLDLVRLSPLMENRPIVVGFTVLDAENSLPLVTILQSGNYYHLEQIACAE